MGDRPDRDLRRIVSATEGQCYQIGHLGEGFELLESESVVSLKARRGGLEKPAYQPREVDFKVSEEREIIKGSAVPRVRDFTQEQYESKRTVSMAEVEDCQQARHELRDLFWPQGTLGSGAVKRVLKEFRDFSRDPPCGLHIFPSEPLLFMPFFAVFRPF